MHWKDISRAAGENCGRSPRKNSGKTSRKRPPALNEKMRTNGAGSWNLTENFVKVWSECSIKALMLAEFGGKGVRWATKVYSRWHVAEGSKQGHQAAN